MPGRHSGSLGEDQMIEINDGLVSSSSIIVRDLWICRIPHKIIRLYDTSKKPSDILSTKIF